MEQTKKLKRSEQAAATKAALTESALRLFAERGYDNVSIADICGSVGVTVGVFYHYFSTKSGVYKELSLSMDERIRAFEPKSSDALGKIAEILHCYAEITRDIGVETMSVILTPANRLVYTNNLSAKRIRSIIEEGQRTGEISTAATPLNQMRLIYSSVWGVVLFWCSVGGEFDLIQDIDNAVRTALLALEPR